jgi:hypothetical protein
MKISQIDYSILKEKINQEMKDRSFPDLLEHYKKEKYGKNPERLLCFNIFYQIEISWRTEFLTGFYQYGNDDHLFTALRKILT